LMQISKTITAVTVHCGQCLCTQWMLRLLHAVHNCCVHVVQWLNCSTAAGNDFSTLYAPLIRDGRMEKFYWAPTREDRVGVSMGIFKEDGVTRGEVEQIVDTFPGQSIDFFGALRARVYDDKVRDFVKNIGMENIGARLINSKDGRVSLLTASCNLTFSPPNFAHSLSMSRLLVVAAIVLKTV